MARMIANCYPSEVHQIGGRAGRFGMSKTGLIAAANKHDLHVIRELYEQTPPELSFARVAPTADDLSLIPGSLDQQLTQWAELKSIPEELRAVITTADMDERIALAKMLSDEDIEKLGLASALQLVNAPTRKTTRAYWLDCAYMILEGFQIPLPPGAPAPIHDGGDLEATELSIACADITSGFRAAKNLPTTAKRMGKCARSGANGRYRLMRRCCGT